MHIVENDLLAVRLVDRHVGGFLKLADGARGLGPLIQELNNSQVERINFCSPVADIHS